MTTFLLMQFLLLPLLLFAIYPYAVQYEKYPNRIWAAALTHILSGYLNFTTFVLYTLDFPMSGEWTFSKRLARLRRLSGFRGAICQQVANYLNYFSPGHVK